MSGKEVIEATGIVLEVCRDATFKVQVGDGILVLAHTSGKVRKSRIRILVHDKVLLEMSKQSVNREGVAMGRIIRRLKNDAV